MIVDDDVDILNIATESLKPLGHKILVAKNGQDALEIAEKSGDTIDLLLTDVIMPIMNGVELAENLTERSSSTQVVFMSGYLRPSMNGQNTPDYEKGFIQKPFSKKTLANHIKDVLKES